MIASPSQRYQRVPVRHNTTLRGIFDYYGCSDKSFANGYYELVKRETVSVWKPVILEDLTTGDFIRDDAARKILGIPVSASNKAVSLSPSDIPSKYRAYIGSNTMTRKLASGTKFIF